MYLISSISGTIATNRSGSILGVWPDGQHVSSPEERCERRVGKERATAIGQSRLILQVDIEIWGLLVCSYFCVAAGEWLVEGWGARISSERLGWLVAPAVFLAVISPKSDMHADQGLDMFSPRRACGGPPSRNISASESDVGGQIKNTCSGCDNWPARTLLARSDHCRSLRAAVLPRSHMSKSAFAASGIRNSGNFSHLPLFYPPPQVGASVGVLSSEIGREGNAQWLGDSA
ncbi:hypothetical protein BU24DRAFT_190055 [Aaosphaeria arxii CBS 175.79]|uniref:Uncharacterized protein n=1 Tax=Aaosphaeria arxii CBS 175.79 TaxID=1450172 RepID=A0A6A5XSX7_9PLEO|nr:uncharacterized protein BU24DRAFT_190055 [Aaosphaeria arxii CBS 175.79]KAF2016009.1 hypothetical protein BU24DRAFT_190055 [Aaosphaeria arxii CBS 175.79]